MICTIILVALYLEGLNPIAQRLSIIAHDGGFVRARTLLSTSDLRLPRKVVLGMLKDVQ